MPTDAISGVDYALGSAAPNGAANQMAMAISLRGKTIRTATDSADRDSKFGAGSGTTVPDGTIVTAPTTGTVWMKTATRWSTLFQGPTLFTPQISAFTTGTVTSSSATAAQCYYEIVNDVVHAHAEVSLTADVTQCCVSLPVTAPRRYLACGVCALYGASGLPADQTGIAYMADTSRLVITAYSNGFRDGTSGTAIRYDVHYPLI